MRRKIAFAIALALVGISVSGCHDGHPGRYGDHPGHHHDHGDHDHDHDHFR